MIIWPDVVIFLPPGCSTCPIWCHFLVLRALLQCVLFRMYFVQMDCRERRPYRRSEAYRPVEGGERTSVLRSITVWELNLLDQPVHRPRILIPALPDSSPVWCTSRLTHSHKHTYSPLHGAPLVHTHTWKTPIPSIWTSLSPSLSSITPCDSQSTGIAAVFSFPKSILPDLFHHVSNHGERSLMLPLTKEFEILV